MSIADKRAELLAADTKTFRTKEAAATALIEAAIDAAPEERGDWRSWFRNAITLLVRAEGACFFD